MDCYAIHAPSEYASTSIPPSVHSLNAEQGKFCSSTVLILQNANEVAFFNAASSYRGELKGLTLAKISDLPVSYIH